MNAEASAHLIQHHSLSAPGDVLSSVALWPWEKTMVHWENLQMHSPAAHEMVPPSDLSLSFAK